MNTIESELLQITAAALFKKDYKIKPEIDYVALLDEAEAQVVYSIVYPLISSAIPPQKAAEYMENHYRHLILNIAVEDSHADVHKLMTGNSIEYVTIKGCASAKYYPESELRCMGDVDFLVRRKDYEKAIELVKDIGFVPNEDDDESHHQAFQKELILWEVHHSLNGLPDGETGRLCKEKLSGIFETAVMFKKEDKQFLMTDDYHHGLVMLLHLVEHITTTGVGLRHICDWAVFVNYLSEEKFREMYEKDLKEIGLWQFARIITALCVEYLGLSKMKFAENIDKNLLCRMISDIIEGGNFGKKDKERYHSSMISSDKNDSGSSVSKSFFKTLNKRARYRMPVTEKVPVLLPIGWIYVGANHLKMVIKGERPSMHPAKMLKKANARTELNRSYRLFERER